jgi:hypothetical protein
MAIDHLDAWVQLMAAERCAQAPSRDANGECEAAT